MWTVSLSSPLLHLLPSVLGPCGPIFQNTCSNPFKSGRFFSSPCVFYLWLAQLFYLFSHPFISTYYHFFTLCLYMAPPVEEVNIQDPQKKPLSSGVGIVEDLTLAAELQLENRGSISRSWRFLFTHCCSNYKHEWLAKRSIRPQITNQMRLALLRSVFSFLSPLLFICLHLACHPVPPRAPSPLS